MTTIGDPRESLADAVVRPRRPSRGPARVVRLDGSGRSAPQVGGKAASLDTLVGCGFRVPPAAALTTAAYRHFVASSPRLAAHLEELARRPSLAAGSGEDERREVDQCFLATPVPDDLTREILDALAELPSPSGRYAVRSSATAEDLEAASFAGQHLSLLDVEPSEVVEAIRHVWASLWHPAPRAYRERMGVPHTHQSMGVVLQVMVPADRSGVCFTADPTGAPTRGDTLRLEVVDGSGEALVSGRVTPTVHQLALPSLRPLGGAALDPALRSVARRCLLVEEELGGRPQDVEWALVGDEPWILQARPITVAASRDGDGFDTPNRPGDRYAPAGVAEMLPGVLPPLLWTVNGPMVEEGFRHLLGRLGVMPDDLVEPYGFLARIDGQAALDLTRVKEAARRMAGGTGAEVERQYLGQVVGDLDEDATPPLHRRIAMLGASLRALRLRRRVQHDATSFERSVGAVLDLHVDHRELRSAELVAYRNRVRDLASSGVATEVGVAVAAVASYRALEVALDRWLGDRASRWAQRVTRDASGGPKGACACAATIWSAFEVTDGRDALAAVIESADPEDVEQRLAATGPAGAAFLERLWEGLDRLGSAAVYGGPTWREQPQYVWRTLLGCLRARIRRGDHDPFADARDGAARALAVLERELTRTRRWRLTRILTGQVVDVRLRVLRRLVENARSLLALRESVKVSILALGGLERRATLVLAERLSRRGALPSSSDVELLSDAELERLATGRASVPFDELEGRRAANERAREAPPLAPLLDHRGRPVATERGGDGLLGWGASAGVHRGRIRLVVDPARAVDLEPGDVLVATSTDPSWTPLFLVAGAIVVERGGPLSHSAIVARELGLPAVLNAAGAMDLPDGALVEVDGTEGTVTLLPEDPACPGDPAATGADAGNDVGERRASDELESQGVS